MREPPTTVKPQRIPEYVLDLELPPPKRLAEVISRELPVARQLFVEAARDFEGVPVALLDSFGGLYREFGGPFQAELQAWARALGLSFGQVAAMNCGYELDHLQHCSSPELWMKAVLEAFGCTTGLLEMQGYGLVHLRTLDWPLLEMGEATRLFRYRKEDHEFVSLGFPGFVGVLSGMVPGEYSATLNWAPPTNVPDFHFGPSFLLRKTLEECRSYEGAVERLSKTRLSTGAFYTVCGKAARQACVIERTARSSFTRPLVNGSEAQSNHFVCEKFEACNQALHLYKRDPLIRTTRKRRDAMLKALRRPEQPVRGTSEDFLAALTGAPITNQETVQRLSFCAAKGELRVERLRKGKADEYYWGRGSWRFEVRT
jgi:hypothetical protein